MPGRCTKPGASREPFEQQYGVPAGAAWRHLDPQIGRVLLGLVILTLGAKWPVDGAVTIARLLGLNELLIGLTIVAVGTSLPEVAASVLAARRGLRDIAVGNVIGSNLFNILCVLGLSANAGSRRSLARWRQRSSRPVTRDHAQAHAEPVSGTARHSGELG